MGEPAAPTRASVIRVHRQQGFYRDSLRRYQARIDSSPAGTIAAGETEDFFVPPANALTRAGSSDVSHLKRHALVRA
jgi:hypothetical protein